MASLTCSTSKIHGVQNVQHSLPRGGISALRVRKQTPRSVKRFAAGNIQMVAAPIRPETTQFDSPPSDESFDYSAPPPFTLADIKNAIPKHCWEKDAWKSMGYLVLDLAIVAGLAIAANAINSWFVWPIYWLAQGTMFWALFVIGHDW